MLTQRAKLLAMPRRNTRSTLSPSFNAAVWRMAYLFNPDGWLTSVDGPTSLSGLRAAFNRDGKITVSNQNLALTIYDRPATNIAFRAWHDATHLALQDEGLYAEFDGPGEHAVMRRQQRDLCETYGSTARFDWWRILAAEIMGQIEYRDRHGSFPIDQYACTIDYLTRNGGGLENV